MSHRPNTRSCISERFFFDILMRVVILYNTSWYVYLLRRNLIARLQELGCEVIVVAPYDNYTDRLRRLGCTHVAIPLEPGSTSPLTELKTFASITRALRALQPAAVLSFTIKCNLYAGLAKRFVRFRQIANISGLGSAFGGGATLRRIATVLYRLALKDTEHIFFQNREDLASCVHRSLVSRERSKVIPGSGVDLAAFTPSQRSPGRPRTFLMFGRLIPAKGYDLFLAVARRLRDEFGDSVACWILGKPDHERSESIALYHRITRAHADGTIRYLQSSDDVRPILSEADAVVLPSTYNEGVPRSLLEALASGKVIITTDWKGCRETVTHGHNGYLVSPYCEESLYDAMRGIITAPESSLRALGRSSRERAETLFDERIVLDAYCDALDLATPLSDIPALTQATGTTA